MGFIKFLKKKNEQDTVPKPPQKPESQPESQEMPPPPDFNSNEDFPPPPSIEEKDSLPDFPEIKHDSEGIPPPPEEDYSFEPPSQQLPEQTEQPSEESMVPQQEPQPQNPVAPPQETKVEPQPQVETNMSETEIISQVNEQKDNTEEFEQIEPEGPIYIRSENFQKVLGRIKTTKTLMKEFEDKVFAMNELKTKEEKKYGLWKSKLEDMQRKLIYVDKILFEKP